MTYSLQRGFDDEHWLVKYGFVPTQFVPILGQVQSFNNPNPRQIVGTTAWTAGSVSYLDWFVRTMTQGNSGYIRGGQRKIMALGGAFPSSPYGKFIRGAGALSAAIVYFDAIDWFINAPLLQGSSWVDHMTESMNPFNWV